MDLKDLAAQIIMEKIGSANDKVEAFAQKLGIGKEEASSRLSEILPQLIDKSSQGGNLLDSIGGTSGMSSLASKLFK